jgi:ADP-ribose pyrophosphatase YjhB (NUDIX family)
MRFLDKMMPRNKKSEHNRAMSESSRLYPARPLVGASAAIMNRDRVLLVQRGHEPLKGMWSFPGGLVKAGETLVEAARRELEEETGVYAEGLKPVDTLEIIEHDGDLVRHHYVLVVHGGFYKSGSAKAASDAAALCWADYEDAQKLELTQGCLAIIKKLTGS